MAKIQSWVGFLLALLFPLFFLTTTQEFFTTNKFYFLGFSVLLLLTFSAINLLSGKKLSWRRSPFDVPVFIFLILYATSVMIVSPNKIQALLNPVTGFGVMLFLGLMYYVLHQESAHEDRGTYNHLALMDIAAGIVAGLTLFFYFNPFAKVNLPQNLAFLKNPSFTPLGTQIDLLLFLGFFVLYGGLRLYYARNAKKTGAFNTLVFIVVTLSFFLTLYNVLRPVPGQAPSQDGKKISIYNTLPPYSISWYAAVETLKSPKTALFGVGPDNFAAVYTRVKPASYNATPLWNVNYTQARSFLLELWATTGILGLGSFILLLLLLVRSVKNTEARYNTFYLIAVLALFPASLVILFLLFLMIAFSTKHVRGEARSLDLSNTAPAYVGIAVLGFLLIGGLSYLLGRSYVAEYHFKKSLDAFPSNKAELVYNSMRDAIVTNPYIERYRVSFSQLNMLIANNLAAAAQQKTQVKEGEEPAEPQISEQDRNIIAQGIQAAIAEAKAAVALNPNKASNWENLAVIYRNIINVAQGADEWTVASYQRAILIDPNNPIYHLNLGGVFYQLQGYDQAINLFSQAASLKQDWPNAFYNLAWAHYQKEDYERAALAMQQVLTLLPDKKGADYKKAQKEFEDFKKKIPAEGTEATPSGQLNLPTPPAASIEPKLQLPKNAEPPTGGPTPRATTTPSVTGQPSPTPEE